MNITVHFTHNGAEENGKPLVHMNIVLSSIKLQVSKPQYDMFVSLGEHTAGFFKELSERQASRFCYPRYLEKRNAATSCTGLFTESKTRRLMED